jgi:glutamyl-tRNA synthetase
MEFARLNVDGMPVSKRRITPLIEEGIVSGYDDVRLPTLRGLKRRGIVPEGIRQFVLMQGISKVESTVPFSLVESENRKVIDKRSKRLFFVPDPVRLSVPDAPEKQVTIPFHPTEESLGARSMTTGGVFYVPRQDMKSMVTGEVFRLKDLFNVEIMEIDDDINGRFAGVDLVEKSKKVQWTPDRFVPVTVTVPDLLIKNDQVNKHSLTMVKGYAEPAIGLLDEGDIVQFERFGFVRIEQKNDEIVGIFTHK